MANRIKIEILSQPANYTSLVFSVAITGYSKTISKFFIPGFDSSPGNIVIGADAEATLTNLHTKLSLYDVDGNISFELAYPFIYCNFLSPEVYVLTVTNDAADAFTVVTEDIVLPEPNVLEPLVYKDISIRIFDTYINERVLIEELASADACKIDWDAGDDLYKEIMASKCVFNMLVPTAEDAHFIHLFSGDEQRYRVEVVGIDEDDNEQLIWQGFLLPDQYNEPYKNVSFFVDFTATDMISSLKGKYLEPWYYQNTIPIAQVFAYCFTKTGLQQNMIVKPSVVPNGYLFLWNAICVDMRTFIKDDKYEDCYKIIESLLVSNVLTLTSYRGYWWLEGVHRKGDLETTNYQFDADGNRVEDIVTNKVAMDCIGSLQPTPNFIALTPWKKVNVDFEPDGTKNLFTDWVVRIPTSNQFYSLYKASGYSFPIEISPQVYGVVKLVKWIENLTAEYKLSDYFNPYDAALLGLGQRFSILHWVNVDTAELDYNLTEASALNKYIECPETPFVKPGNLYEMEMEFEMLIRLGETITENEFKREMSEGYYDKLVAFQVFINNVEKFSNRPSFSSETNLRFVGEISPNGNVSKVTFKLKFNFNSDIEGFVKVRFLMPIFQTDLGDFENITWYRTACNELKLTLVEDYDENADTVAVRPINYTQELDFPIDITCTVDNSVLNSFKLGYPIDSDYIKTIDRTIDNEDFIGHHYFLPNVDLELLYNTFDVPPALIKLLFEFKKLKSVFLENVDGTKILFGDLWFYLNPMVSKLAYLKSHDGFPVIPKKYKAYPDVEPEDELKYMYVQYAPENYANRLKWRLWNSDVIDTYPKTVAKALHGVHPEMIYRLEASALKLIFPDNLIDFYFDNNDRNFIPTTLKLDLFNGKTSFVATEAKFTELTDITYEQ